MKFGRLIKKCGNSQKCDQVGGRTYPMRYQMCYEAIIIQIEYYWPKSRSTLGEKNITE